LISVNASVNDWINENEDLCMQNCGSSFLFILSVSHWYCPKHEYGFFK